jgi:hypothetical protein
MPSPEAESSGYVQTIFAGIADWVGKFRQNFGSNNQLGLCTPDEVIRAARDLGLLDQSGHWSILAEDGLSANDPKRTLEILNSPETTRVGS